MMMTKPAPSAPAAEVKKKSTPEDAVKDLEKRLQLLETTNSKPAATTSTTPAPAAVAAPKTTGKNPLLARIMAAQEKAKQVSAPATAATTTTATPAVTDLLDTFDAPAESASAPPPPFDISLLPPPEQEPPPPAFDDYLLPPPSQFQQSTNTAESYPSAPVFEDLLDHEEETKMPHLRNVTPLAPPPPSQLLDQDAIDAILGLEGLSQQEKEALIAEQEKILASIQMENKKGAVQAQQARADAFEQRSHAAAVQAIGNTKKLDLGAGGGAIALHGQEKTRQAIQDGTAIVVQCLSCESWMQVTSSATMMFCPNCQTVSPVCTQEDKEMASQMAADLELAEQLQKEEYKKAGAQRTKAATTTTSPKAASSAAAAAAAAAEPSWMEWLGFGTPTTTTTTTSPPADRVFAQKPLQRGEIAMSLPPGASRNNTALAMAPAYTGEEEDDDDIVPRFSRSHESNDMADEGGARVAKSQPLFSCVADSISSAATSLYHTVAADTDGNVHGVDTSGLLAVTQAGRGEYQNMDDNHNNNR